jgi:hypothetical protein
VVRTSVTGPNWMTGGNYGIEASATGTIAVLIGLVIVWKLPVNKLIKSSLPLAEPAHQNGLSGIQP